LLGIEKLDEQYHGQLEEIQARLIDLGAQVATPRNSDEEKKVQHTSFDAKCV
jgi:cob(I)alamin adenosyltransferase